MSHRGNWLSVLLVGGPTGLAMALGWPATADAGQWLGWLGRLSGVAGLACLLAAAILSVRIPGLDRYFGGLSRLWHQHHYLGLAAFVLLLAHPPLMALSRSVWGPAAAREVLLPATGDWALWTGWLGLLAMMIFLAPSFQFFGRPDYQRWKALHFMAGIALVAGLVHTLPLSRALPGMSATLVWGGIGGLALLVFLWRALLARPLLRRRYRVMETRPLADRIVEIALQPQDKGMLDYQPGQFLYFTPLDTTLKAGLREEHPFTISSAPGDEMLRIAVKDLGDASHALQTLSEGSTALVEGPYGDFFSTARRQTKQLWIGGGIGITPFVSGAEAIRRGEPWGHSLLINCANDPDRAYYLDRLQAAAEEQDSLTVVAHYFLEHGPLDTAFVRQHCPDAAERDWYVCGPPVLVKLVRQIARELNIPGSRFHAEVFDFL